MLDEKIDQHNCCYLLTVKRNGKTVIRVPDKLGTARVVHQDSTTITIRWPWYWRLLNNLHERWRRR